MAGDRAPAARPTGPPPRLAGSIVDVIGATPLLDATRIVADRGLAGRLFVKLEHLNPGGSKKDRAAAAMIRAAKASGELRDGQPVVELTSGNTGTGLALVCGALGHELVAVMSRGNTPERARMMRAFGARVELVDQAPGSAPGRVSGHDLELVEQRTAELVTELGAFRADQFRLISHVDGHRETTGPELWEQSRGTIDVFADFVGSGGSFTGIAAHLRSVAPAVRAYVVEPDGAAVLAGEDVEDPSHPIQGGGYSMADLPLLDRTLVTGYRTVTADAARRAARDLARLEGVFGGYSTGANVAAALELLATDERGATVAVLACDSGLKYLSTDLYD